MKTKNVWAVVEIILLALAFGCGEQSSDDRSNGDPFPAAVGSWEITVDLDHAGLEIAEGLKSAAMTVVDGHTVEVRNGPAGCSWEDATDTLTCEILFRNLDSDECMREVRTRIHDSTNPSAIVTGADYIWPGPTINSNTAQPINNSGYCITESSPDSGGSAEGCGNTWQDNIPAGAIATQNFVFTNVPGGLYRFYLQVFATYQPCSAPAGMARIPAGCFDMGDIFGEGTAEELPVHNACLTADFYLDQFEATNGEYAGCIAAEACTAPADATSGARDPYFFSAVYADYPVLNVSWEQATDFCAWLGKRVPTETEWEYAARGGLSRRRYPGGDSIICSEANFGRANSSSACWDFNGLGADTQPGGGYAANGYRLYDMAGNVGEWVNDWFSDTYYGASPADDPAGPGTGTLRVTRGGSWDSDGHFVGVSVRGRGSPSSYSFGVGFRCAEATPETRPLVIFVTPPDLATAVPYNTAVNATFSRAMDPATILLPATYTLKAGALPIAGTVSYAGLIATFTPSEPLAPLTTYTATITTAARDLAGNGLLTNYVWSFTTAALVGNSPAPVTLNTVADFAILAGSALTDVPTSAITGDVGLTNASGAAITGLTCPEVTGTIYKIDAAGPACGLNDPIWLADAKAALMAAYNDAAGRAGPSVVMVAGDQGGVTLPPGIYKSTSSLAIGAGNLTLDAQGNPNAVWIFQIGSTLITTGCGTTVPCANGGNVILANGANAANIFWQVGSSATIGDYTAFNGTILAWVSISVNTGAQIQGRLLSGAQPSGAGAITLISNAVTKP